MLFWNKICGFIAIFFLSSLFSTAQKFNHSLSTPANRLILYTLMTDSAKSANPHLLYKPSAYLVSPDYYTQHMGFICKKELAIEKFTNVPLRFRLGSLQQCNYLEGKK